MNWKKIILYGVLIIAVWIFFLVISFFLNFILRVLPFNEGLLFKLTMLFITAIVFWLISGRIELNNNKTALTVGLMWLIIWIILDRLIVYGILGATGKMGWVTWLTYILILLMPLARQALKSR